MDHLILMKAIVGSQAYGTSTPESDIDIKGIYLQDPLDVLSFNYKQQIELDKDTALFEIRRFLELLESSNPTMLELLFTPNDCLLEKHPLFDIVLEHKQEFITKGCANSFMGYAKQQIYKASGLNKKMNWEKERIERKRPIDFLRVIDNEKTYPLLDYLKKHEMKEEFCGLVKVNNTERNYCLYYDDVADMKDKCDLSNPRFESLIPLNYKGICNDVDLLLSEIPSYQIKGGKINLYYNLNGFQEHCKDYNSYQTWLKERNTARYVDVKNHGQQIDGKNMLHCYRLIEMAKEIAIDGTFQVRRNNAEELLKIRKGEVSLQELLDKSNNLIKEVDELFNQSSLPEKIDRKLIDDILRKIRKESLKLF